MATNTATRGRSMPRGIYVRMPTETRPFFLTSEFFVLVLMTVSLFIASAVVDDLDSRLAWILGTALVGSYILSRGIAKAASYSTTYDPREDLLDEVDDDGRSVARSARIRD
jgi:hypothetical protein